MNKKNITIIILTAILGISAGFVYTNKGSEANEDNVNVITDQEQLNQDKEIESIKDSLSDTAAEEEIVNIKDADFGFKLEEGMEELEFGTPWKSNANGNMAVAIEGRGPEAIEEGLGFVCLKNNDEVKFLFVDKEDAGISPKYVEWYDNDNFLVYMVGSYGRVFSGGALYMINVNDMKPKLIYKAKENEEISEATQINADIINMKILEYKDGSKVSVDKNIKLK